MDNYGIKVRELADDFALPIEKGGIAIGENTTEEDKELFLDNLAEIGIYTGANITTGPEPLEPGISPLPSGHIYLQYE